MNKININGFHKVINGNEQLYLDEPDNIDGIISTLSPVSWLHIDEISLNNGKFYNKENFNESEQILKDLTYELCRTKASYLHNSCKKYTWALLLASLLLQSILMVIAYLTYDLLSISFQF
ncbi:hypothetical protein ACR3K2_32830 [Cryptosporidium serpentis]